MHRNTIYVILRLILLLYAYNNIQSYLITAQNHDLHYKFFEKSRIIENEDGSFSSIGRNDVYKKDIINLEKSDCFLDSVILTDAIAAVYYWKSQGINVGELSPELPYINIDVSNIPYYYIKHSLVREYLGKQFQGIMGDDPGSVTFSPNGIKLLKEGLYSIDVDYAIKQDSLIITIYRCLFKMNDEKVKKYTFEHVNFIHKYDCHDNRWKLVKVNDKGDYLPGIHSSDYLRKAITDDVNYYLSFIYRYRKWNFQLKSEICGQEEDEDDNNGEMASEDRADGYYSLADFCKINYLVGQTFPISTLDKLDIPINIFPRNLYFRKDYSEICGKVLKESKLTTSLELKMIADSLIVHFHTESSKYIPKKKITETHSIALGYFVHKFDSKTNQWERVGEYIYIY